MRFVIQYSDEINGLLKPCVLEEIEINRNIITEIYCIGFGLRIKEFPNWSNLPNLKTIICPGCEYLEKLPPWPNVEEVDCGLCLRLRELPLWPKIKKINCRGCYLLKRLPLWPNIEEVYCYGCLNLKTLSKWTKIKNIRCTNCPKLICLPTWFYVQEFIAEREKIRERNNKIRLLILSKSINQNLLNLIYEYLLDYKDLNF